MSRAHASDELRALVESRIRDVPDFPTPGILFKDIGPLLADPEAFAAIVADGARRHTGKVDFVAGIEARGFIFGAGLAHAMGVGFIPVRVQEGAVAPGSRVIVVDDVLATGGTAAAACALLELVGAEIIGLDVVMELADLGGRSALVGREVHSLTVA